MTDGYRVNRQIKSENIRLIDAEGEMIGVVSIAEGLRIAETQGLDLIEVSPNANPPVCKLLDSGKFKYEIQKKKAAAKKNQKIVEIKEIKLCPVTGDNDYMVKLKNARRFLEGGDKVKVTIRFRGREIDHKELGERMMLRMQNDLADLGKSESSIRMEGRQLMMIVAPLKAAVPLNG